MNSASPDPLSTTIYLAIGFVAHLSPITATSLGISPYISLISPQSLFSFDIIGFSVDSFEEGYGSIYGFDCGDQIDFGFKIEMGFSSALKLIVDIMAIPHEPHFFKPLLPGFHSGVTIPLAFFSKHIEGKTNQKTWKLRSDASDQTWEVLLEGRTLTGGWKDFTTAHDLQIGDLVIFKHERDMVFHVTPFGPSCCEIQYTQPHIIKEEADSGDADDNEIRGTGAMSSLSYDFCFLAEVTASNLKADKLYLPK
ncbi:hypothetical protein IGI04_014828 [Brassica rapa subsp. trilocularis]|uniref:TF-B3 domain-containing protein n=1 Tax=Brassica rapa subsp. trilocularis TaxID=1813537 RepID=A0ABQ7MRC9_BRACM|nr:hypothetical protein IGI04_014828 [Brassica rapa subsp. trilocularis]